jgi:hypothetical protein
MTLATLRLALASIWCGCWLLTCVCIALAPLLRKDRFVHYEDVVGLIGLVSGLWLPPLCCFAGFWFPARQAKVSKRITVSKEQKCGAIGLTAAYMLLVVILLLTPVYLVEYRMDAEGNLVGQNVSGRLSEVVRFALLLSPIALTPLSYLTGGQTIQTKQPRGNADRERREQQTVSQGDRPRSRRNRRPPQRRESETPNKATPSGTDSTSSSEASP